MKVIIIADYQDYRNKTVRNSIMCIDGFTIPVNRINKETSSRQNA